MTEHVFKMTTAETEVLSRIDCARGDTVKIELPAIPSTGYMWELDKLPEGIHCLFQEFRPADVGDPEICGAGGTDIWTFKVRALKVWVMIELGMRRVWEDDEPAIRRCSLILMPHPSSTEE